MKVKELLSCLRLPCKAEIRENIFFLCSTVTDSKVMEVFNEREIIDWFPSGNIAVSPWDLVINIAEVK